MYKEIVRELVEDLGGTENIIKVKKDKNEIIFIVYNDEEVSKEQLKKIKKVKSVKTLNDQILINFKNRDVRYIFDSLKELPNSTVITIPPPEEEINDKPFLERLTNSLFGDFLPLIIGIGTMSLLVGIVNYIARALS